jgi:rod shape-determining protein MreB
MIVDIGGTTEIAVIALGGIVCDKSKNCRWRFHEWYRILYMYPTQSICGESTEKIKIQIWAVIEDLETPPEDMSVQGEIYLPVNQNK